MLNNTYSAGQTAHMRLFVCLFVGVRVCVRERTDYRQEEHLTSQW